MLAGGGHRISAASPFEVLYRFATNFEEPSSALIEAADGALYGTTIATTSGTAGSLGVKSGFVGTIYRFASGQLTTIHKLTPADGWFSGTSLVLGHNNLYGTTRPSLTAPLGGTVFQLNASGALSVAHRFSAATLPAHLLQATDGNYYGTASGNLESVIFRMTPSGDVTVLHKFVLAKDGALNSLMQGPDTHLYGTTETGGGGLYAGTVFRLSLSGEFTLLYTFQKGRTDEGRGPVGVTLGADGSLYGTTAGGGGPVYALLGDRGPNLGTVFKLSPDLKLTTLHRFNGSDGAVPLHGLVDGGNGFLYGTTSVGGPHMFGTIFKISPQGRLTTVHSMTEAGAFLPLMRGQDGRIYGARTGALQRPSVIFRLSAAE